MRVEKPVPVDQAAFATQLLATLRGAISRNSNLNVLVEKAKPTNGKVTYTDADGVKYDITPHGQAIDNHRVHPGFHVTTSSSGPIFGPYNIISIKLFERDPQCAGPFAPFSMGFISEGDLLDTQEVDEIVEDNPRITAGDVAIGIIDRLVRATRQPEVTPEAS